MSTFERSGVIASYISPLPLSLPPHLPVFLLMTPEETDEAFFLFFFFVTQRPQHANDTLGLRCCDAAFSGRRLIW